jgi:hypothetical protein
MALPLKESQTATELAEKLYPFLPGKPHPYADQSLSFPGVASQLGLAQYWPQGGSKGPAISRLLTAILERERNRFCSLIETIIQRGVIYRKRNNPVMRDELDAINGLLLKIGFKIPSLYDADFLNALPRAGKSAAVADAPVDPAALERLQNKLMEIGALQPVNRGFAFEDFIKDMFLLYGLAPRGAFRLVGEQIDGSFDLDGEIYLVEARWRNEKTALSDLLGLSGKIQGKATWSRGLFISYAGFSEDGLHALGQGRRTEMVGMDALDVYHVLSGRLDLRELLRRKVRRAAETNRFFVPARELFPSLI